MSLKCGVRTELDTYLALVEIVNDFPTEALFAVPLGLSGIMQKLFERPLVPVQQLPVQQQSERCLCDQTHS